MICVISDSYYLPDSEDMNTFTAEDDTPKRVSPAEGSQAYQPYKFGDKSQHNGDDRSSSDDDSYRYKKQRLSDDELSSEPGYAKVGANGKILRDNIDGSRDPPQTKQNDIYGKVNKGNNRPVSNGREYCIYIDINFLYHKIFEGEVLLYRY